MDKMSKLFDLAKQTFKTLTPAEVTLFQLVAMGKDVKLLSKMEKDNNPLGADKWGEDRVLNADRINWLCTDAQASRLVPYWGIQVCGARIDGKLDLQFAKISFPLVFEKCAVYKDINLSGARIFGLYLSGTYTCSIIADGLKVDGNLYLNNGFKANGTVHLSGATIGGDLNCDKGKFINPKGYSIKADGIEVKCCVFMRKGFRSTGKVCLPDTVIGGSLYCNKGQFVNPEGVALSLNAMRIKNSVFLCNGFKAQGEVALYSGMIGSNLHCTNGQFINPGGIAFGADRLNVNNSVLLNDGFKAKGEVRLYSGTIGGNLECENGQFINHKGDAIGADGVDIGGRVLLSNNFKADGEVHLRFAKIGISLECSGGQFINPGRVALGADGVRVYNEITLNQGFKSEGEVTLRNGKIGGNIECDKGQFINPNGFALDAACVKVEDSVILRDIQAQGEVCFSYGTIGMNLNCQKGQFINSDKCALDAENLIIEGGVFLNNGFKAKGEVCLDGATIGKDLKCEKSQFINPELFALHACRLKVGDRFLGNDLKVEGTVNLMGATIGSTLNFEGSQLINPDGYALVADRLKVKDSVFLRYGFKAEGSVRILGATIGGSLECQNGQFIYPEGYAILMGGLHVAKNLRLSNGFRAEGEICLDDAVIGQNLDCGGNVDRGLNAAQLMSPNLIVFRGRRLRVGGDVCMCGGFKAEGLVNLAMATITGHFFWTNISSPLETTLDIRFANIGVLCDDQLSWPKKGNLFLSGLVYNEIAEDAPRDVLARLDWLRRQGDEQFRPETYEQLATVFRKMGLNTNAKDVLIAKNDDRAQLMKLRLSERLRYRLLRLFIGYGYCPWKVVWWALAIIILGSAFFGIGFRVNLMSRTEGLEYLPETSEGYQLLDNHPRFNSLVYSIDTFVPLIDLHQSKYWLPNAKRGTDLFSIKGFGIHTGELLLCYMWVHIIMGWMLTTLLVASLTGLIRT